jgi:hypothetical protein
MEEQLHAALDGRAIALLGSGFTFGAKNEDDRRVPTVEDLLAFFNAPFPTAFGSYRSAAERYVRDERYGPAHAFASLKRQFTIKSSTSTHKVILGVPWKRIYTTNFDNLVERTLGGLGNSFRSLNAAKDNRPFDRDRLNIVHLNGMFDEMGNVDFDNLIRLTDSSYIAERFSSRPYFASFRNEMRTASAIFIIGYSVPDLDIAQILKEDARIRDKTVIITKPDNSEEELFYLSRFGEIHQIGIDDFATKIDSARIGHVPQSATERLYSLKRLTAEPSPDRTITDRARFDLYIYGDFKRDLYLKQDNSVPATRYSVERIGAAGVVQRLKQHRHVIVAHGHLGSGKTIFVEEIASLATQAGFDVWAIDRFSEFLMEELETLVKISNRPTILIVENYERYDRELRFLLEQYRSNISVIATARTYVHDTAKTIFTRSNRHDVPILTYNLNKLTTTEIAALAGVLLSAELVGAFQIPTPSSVERIIARQCNGEIREVLLYLFRSKHIQEKLWRQFDANDLDASEKHSLLVCFIIRVLAVTIPVSELEDVFVRSQPAFRAFFERPEIKEMLRIDADEVVSVSPAMAQFFVRSRYTAREVRETLTEITRISFNLRTIVTFNELHRACIQYGRIRELFSGTDLHSEIIAFYDAAKNMDAVRQNPYFFVQYGIARWSRRERDLTDSCIANARRVGAQLSNFVPFQIDHFEATVRIEAHEPTLGATYKDDVRFATRVMRSQINDDRTRFHPLALGGIVSSFVIRHKNSLAPGDVNFIRTELTAFDRDVVNSEKMHDFPDEAQHCRERLRLALAQLSR